jgi:hypothetical protein
MNLDSMYDLNRDPERKRASAGPIVELWRAQSIIISLGLLHVDIHDLHSQRSQR